MRNQLFCRRLAVGAGNRDQARCQAAAVKLGQIPQGPLGLLYLKNRDPWRWHPIREFFNKQCPRPLLECLRNKLVPVITFAPDRDKKIAGLQGP